MLFLKPCHCQLSLIFPPFSTSLSSHLAPCILSINMCKFFSLWGQRKLQPSLDSKSHYSSLSLSLYLFFLTKLLETQSILIVLSSFLINSSTSTIWFLPPHSTEPAHKGSQDLCIINSKRNFFLVHIFLDLLGICSNIIPSLLLDSLYSLCFFGTTVLLVLFIPLEKVPS